MLSCHLHKYGPRKKNSLVPITIVAGVVILALLGNEGSIDTGWNRSTSLITEQWCVQRQDYGKEKENWYYTLISVQRLGKVCIWFNHFCYFQFYFKFNSYDKWTCFTNTFYNFVMIHFHSNCCKFPVLCSSWNLVSEYKFS